MRVVSLVGIDQKGKCESVLVSTDVDRVKKEMKKIKVEGSSKFIELRYFDSYSKRSKVKIVKARGRADKK